MGRTGFSLPETVMAMFVLVGGMLAVVQLFHTGLRHGTASQQRLLAAVLAEKRMGEIRAWAKNPSAFASGAGFPSSTSDPEYPDLTITTWGGGPAFETRFSPSSGMEAPYPAANRRTMAQSFRRVQVRVAWGPGANDRIQILSMVGAPRRDLASITVAPGGATLAPSTPPAGGQLFTATASDGSGPIPDVFFEWYVSTRTGSGTVVPSRSTSNATVFNWVLTPSGAGTRGPGECDVLVRGRSGENERWSANVPVTMTP